MTLSNSKSTEENLKNKVIKVLQWPSQSPVQVRKLGTIHIIKTIMMLCAAV